MPRSRLVLPLSAAACAVAIASSVLAVDASIPASMSKTVPFTEGQAARGAKLYSENCVACHDADLSGGSSNKPLKGRPFLEHWGMGGSLAVLFKYLRENMPPGGSTSLSPDDHSAIMAYLLQENGFKPGAAPLPTEHAALQKLRLPYTGATSGGLTTSAQLPPWPAKPNPAAKLTDVTDEMLRSPPAGEWLSWRRTLDGHGFSPLGEITRANVNGLQLVWSFTLPAGPGTTTPLVHDGVIFVHASDGSVRALDAASGEVLWKFQREGGVSIKRNMALYGDKLYLGTADNHLVALDAKTGKLIWDSPSGGPIHGGPLVVDGSIVQALSRDVDKRRSASEMLKSAAGSDAACVTCNGEGRIIGMDAADGKKLWTFNVIPNIGDPGGNTWNDLPFAMRSGGASWTSAYYDADLGLAFVGTGNSYDPPSLTPQVKKSGVNSDALYTNSTLAIHPKTGKLAWHFAHMPGEMWDMDWSFEQQVITLPVNGKKTKAVVTIGKPGILDAVDAATGRFLFSLDPGLQNIITRIDPVTGAKAFDPAKTPGGTEKLICPQLHGAKNWPPSSYNAETGILYVPLTEACMTMTPVDAGEISPFSSGVRYSTSPTPDSDGKIGRLQAFDLKNQKVLWAARQRASLSTGVLATSGGVIFAGSLDREFAAYDDRTGDVLWKTRLGDVPNAAPISFTVNGKQYVAVVTGFGNQLSYGYLPLVPELPSPPSTGSSIYVFALPEPTHRSFVSVLWQKVRTFLNFE